MKKPNAAIVYQSDSYDTSRPILVGRHVAGEAFLRAYVRHSGADPICCATNTRTAYDTFTRQVHAFSDRAPDTRFIPYDDTDRLAEIGTLWVPGLDLAPFAWLRRRADPTGFSLCGITHTTASPGAMDKIAQLLLAPVKPWDALICTSTAVQTMVRRLLEEWSEYLGERCGARPAIDIQLPVIPLGVDCSRFEDTGSAERHRAAFRSQLGLADDAVVFLYMGRLSYHAKAHPVAMYQGLQQAARRSSKKIVLIQAGWFGNEATRKAFTAAANALCPNVQHLFVDGRDPGVRDTIWFAADVFTSLPDNIQETFGLTPVEAMAAGLPCVVSDWNGYRDTVRNGSDGFLIPTQAPGAGCGSDLALSLAMGRTDYDHTIAYTSQCTAVDIDAAANAYRTLIDNPPLRHRMGTNARTRAREAFDWRIIIERYQTLWHSLAQRRQAEPDAPPAPRHGESPLRMDPFRLFSHYPTATITPDHRVSIRGKQPLERLDHFLTASDTTIAAPVLLPRKELIDLLQHLLAHQPLSVADIQAHSDCGPALVIRSLGWLCKLGIVTLQPPAA